MSKAANHKTNDKPTRQAKIVFIGDAGVGKSSLVLRFVQNNWTPHLTSTIGAAFTTKTLRYDKDVVRWELWDTAGQEQYNSLVPMYYRGALGAVLVYDITSNASFSRLQKWVVELRSCGPAGLVLVVCGNKSDLADQRQVDTKAAEEYARSIGAIYLETSAKLALNVDAIFTQLWKALPSAEDPQHKDSIDGSMIGGDADGVRLAGSPSVSGKAGGGGCCS